jgi:hypothetical protein
VLALVAALLLFWQQRILRPGREPRFGYATDILWYFLPSHTYIAERLRQLELPLWNPYQGAGQPFLATIQPGALYPARLLLLVLDVPSAMHVSTLGHILMALLGTYALCRRLSTDPVTAAAGGATFIGAVSLHHLYSPSYLEAGAWLPIGGLALVRLGEKPSWRWTFVLGMALAMPVLAGGYQMTLYVLYGLALLAVALLLDSRRRGRLAERATLLRLAVAGVLALGTAAPQLLPTLAWTSETTRGPAPLSDAQIMVWNTSAWDALRETFYPVTDWSPFYLSLPAAVLAVLGFVNGGVLGGVLGVGAIGALLVALGSGTPFFTIYRLLPGLAMLRNPLRLVTVVAFACAIGAAIGVTATARAPCLRAGWRGHAAELLALGFVLAGLFGPTRNRALLPWTLPSPAAVDGPPDFLPALRQSTEGGRALLPPTLGIGAGTKIGTMRHVPVLQDYEPLASRRLAAYLYAVSGLPAPAPTDRLPFLGYMPGRHGVLRPELLDLIAVRSMVLLHPLEPPVREPPFIPVFRDDEFTLYANPRALPRAFTVERARFVESEAAALARLVGEDFDGRGEAVLVGRPVLPEEAALTSAAAGNLRPAHVTLDLPERVAVDVEVRAPSLLVLADAFAPGWRVTVDGTPRRLWQANHLVRGVVVQPGERRAEFSYRAPGFRLGMAGAVVAWAVFGLAVAVTGWRKRADG